LGLLRRRCLLRRLLRRRGLRTRLRAARRKPSSPSAAPRRRAPLPVQTRGLIHLVWGPLPRAAASLGVVRPKPGQPRLALPRGVAAPPLPGRSAPLFVIRVRRGGLTGLRLHDEALKLNRTRREAILQRLLARWLAIE